jgi:fatty acid desaturase
MTTGSEFRDDGRAIAIAIAGSGNAAARRWLSAEELAPLTQLSAARSLLAIAQTVSLLALFIGVGAWALGHGHWALVVLCVLLIGPQQHAIFILNHEAAHYRLLPNRWWNDALGSFIGMTGGVSMHTYRVTHRLHHNHLYGPQDPDTAIHGGYPRGTAYLLKKLAQDLVGWNAWKTYAYFFGAPAINAETGAAINPLNDTSEDLRRAARTDRWRVVAFQVLVPIALYFIAINLEWMPANRQFSLIFWCYLVFWLLPLVTVLQPILRLRAILEHGGATDLSSPLTAARSNRTSGTTTNVLARCFLFPHHVNYHMEHHLYPAVPHYHLPSLHAKLRAKGALDGAQVCDVAAALRTVFAPRRIPAKSAVPHGHAT